MGSEALKEEGEFSPRDAEIMGLVACTIIPPSTEYGVPGANDAAILSIILDKAVAHEERILTGLVSLKEFAQEDFKSDVTAENLPDILLQHKNELRSFMGTMMLITAQSYYQDPQVLRSLGLPNRPPFPKGHELPQGDLSLLDPVKKRGKIYREV